MFTVAASTGEFYALSDKEHRKIIETVVAEVNGQVPVIAGTSQAGTRETLRISRFAEKAGVDALMIVSPYYYIPTEEGIYQHFQTVANRVNIGIIVYNNSQVSGCWIQPHLMAQLATIKNIIGLKENTSNIMDYYRMRKALDPTDIVMLCGIGERMFSFETLYASNTLKGFVTSFGNFAPHLSYNLYEASKRRDFAKIQSLIVDYFDPYRDFLEKVTSAHNLYTSILPAITRGRGVMQLSVIKKAMDILGLCGGRVRLPLVDITKQETEELRRILEAFGLDAG